MAEEQLQPGDVVQLKSGGPEMTIAIIEGTTAWCSWYDKATHTMHKQMDFYVAALRKV